MSTVLEEIICSAREAGASDVHLVAGMPPKMRIGGELFSMNFSRIAPADTVDILIDVMPQVLRDRMEERGEYVFSFTLSQGGRCRAYVYKQGGSVALALRLIDMSAPNPEELGIPGPVMDLHQWSSGLVLVTGPSGSGKSTTLSAVISKINDSRESLIVTLEEPVEYVHCQRRSMISQREIGRECRSYAEGIAAAVRGDADVIMVGELGDPESVEAAIAAAETGHLVLAALNAAGAVDSVERILDMFPPYRQERIRARLANVLEMVLFQQLNPAVDGDGCEPAFDVLASDARVRGFIREGRIEGLTGEVQAWSGE